MEDLAGKVAVVTGGASGIGLGIARQLAAAEMAVVIADIEAPAGERAAAALRERGARARFVATDVADRDSVEALAESTLSAFGAVHVVCNNAGVCLGTPMLGASDDDWRWLLSVNLEGVIHGVQVFAPRLVAQGQGGHVVNTASIGGHLAGAWLGIYSMTKFAVVGLSEALRPELAPHGIGVSVLCPGLVRTRLVDAQRNRPPHHAAGAPQLDFLKAGIEAGLDPDRVGAAVVAGIRRDEETIFTDASFRELLAARFQRILDAFDRVEP